MRLSAVILLLAPPLLCQNTATSKVDQTAALNQILKGSPVPNAPLFSSSQVVSFFQSLGLVEPASAAKLPMTLDEASAGLALLAVQETIHKQRPSVKQLSMPTSLLLPSRRERWGFLANGSSFTVTQQPGTVFYSQGTSSAPLEKPNPDKWLYQASVSQAWSSLFLSSGDMAGAVKAFGDSVGAPKDALVAAGPCQTDNKWETLLCLRQGRRRDRMARTLSAFSGTLTYNRLAQIISSALVTDQNRLNQFGGEAVFTPSKLFVSADDWSNTEAVAEYYGPTYVKDFDRQVKQRCGNSINPQQINEPAQNVSVNTPGNLAQCVRSISGSKGIGERFLASILPSVDVKVQTQADLVAKSGVLVQAAYPTPLLLTVKASVDLSRLLPSAKDRATAYAMLSKLDRAMKSAQQNDLLERADDTLKSLESSGRSIDEKDVSVILSAFRTLPNN